MNIKDMKDKGKMSDVAHSMRDSLINQWVNFYITTDHFLGICKGWGMAEPK